MFKTRYLDIPIRVASSVRMGRTLKDAFATIDSAVKDLQDETINPGDIHASLVSVGEPAEEFEALNVQDAIDELAGQARSIDAANVAFSDPAMEGALVAENVHEALVELKGLIDAEAGP